jgi:alkylhydroperoxidase family enzyme
MPEDPSPTWTLKESAISAHEVFTTLREAGFTEDQALKLVALVMTTSKEED